MIALHRKWAVCILFAVILSCTGCSSTPELSEKTAPQESEQQEPAKAETLEPHFPSVQGLSGKLRITDDLPVDLTHRQNTERFRQGYNLTQKGQYEEALKLFQLNIEETPRAGNIDYSYGWGCLCLAKLGRLDEMLSYYRVLCTRFFGWLGKGAGGANRTWRGIRERARNTVAASKYPEKEAILKKLKELEVIARSRYLILAEQLVQDASAGDKKALAKLAGDDYRNYNEALIELIRLGRLKVSGDNNRAEPLHKQIEHGRLKPASGQ